MDLLWLGLGTQLGTQSVMLLNFFGLAILAINAVGMHPKRDRYTLPPFFLRMLGMLALLVLIQTNAALFAHMMHTAELEEGASSVVAIGLRDMIAMQARRDLARPPRRRTALPPPVVSSSLDASPHQ